MSIEMGQGFPQRRSIVLWGVAAAMAVVMSYLFTLALGLGCLAIPVAVGWALTNGHDSALSAQLLLGAFGLAAGLSILWALVPRRIKFEAPGVPIDLTKEERLAKEIEAIAGSLGEAMPSGVYLLAEANAFVGQRGKSGRILAIGLPLLQTLTIAEFRALLAHEFAHFYSGDTRLGPWVCRGRETMVRVFENLGKKSEIMGLLTRWAIVGAVYSALIWFLRMYWKLFLRFTQLISRRQEFRSDEIACYVAGSDSLASALQSINRTGAVVVPYWQSVVFPLAARGYQPRIAESFGKFLAAPNVAKAASDFLEKRVGSTKTDPFDTHPPLGARIAEAKRIGVAAPERDEEYGKMAAISLLEGVDGLEAKLLRKLMPSLTSELKPLVWETSGAEIFVPMWRKEIAPFAELLSGKTLATLTELVKEPRTIAEKVRNPPGLLLNKAKKEVRAMEILGMALSLSLIDNGWTPHFEPATNYLQRDTVKLAAVTVPGGLKSGAMPISQWQEFCTRNGIGDLPLVATKVETATV